MMWSFFSKDGSKDSLYEIEKKVTSFDNESLFVLFKGKIKSNGKNVSIFKFDTSFSSQPDKVANAKASIKRLKTIRHPSIISIIDSNEESNDIFFVTEYVIPLKVYLEENLSSYTKEQKYYTACYGLCQVAIGLNFLTNDCNLQHNNININTIYLTDKGNWKIGGLDYVTDNTSVWPSKLFASLDRYDPPERSRNRPSSERWTRDAYGLGCLIYEIFSGPFETASSLERPKGLPSELNADYLKLINANPTSRLNFKEFIGRFRGDRSSTRNVFVETMFFLDEIQIKDQAEKTRFFAELNENIDHFPPKICKKKILPKILESLELNIDTAILLESMFKIGKSLSAEKYEQQIVPVIVKLYTFKDRLVRSKLLSNVECYIEHLKPKTVNEIYLNVSQGFLDSNPTIREQTVKSMLHFAPKLTSDNLNDNLLKNFTRIQVRDEETSIRTNTTVCLAKIACYLKPDIRQKVIVMAFVRCLRDPFAPARLAALNALRSTQMFYPLQAAATQVMPALCHLTIDQEKKVRDEAFKLLGEFVEKVRRVSENPAVIDEIESELEVSYSNNNKFTNTLAGAWASWAVSSFTSKLSLSKTSKPEGGKQPAASNNPPSANSQPSNSLSSNSHMGSSHMSNSQSTNSLSSNSTNNGVKRLGQPATTSHSMKLTDEKKSDASDYEGWDDAEDRLSLTGKESRAMNLKSIRNETEDRQSDKSGWEIEDLNGFGDEKSDPWDSGEFSSKGDKADLFKNTTFKSSGQRDKRLDGDARSKENSAPSARPKTSAAAKPSSKSKTLEDELFESLAEPSVRKKRTGAMKLGAKKA